MLVFVCKIRTPVKIGPGDLRSLFSRTRGFRGEAPLGPVTALLCPPPAGLSHREVQDIPAHQRGGATPGAPAAGVLPPRPPGLLPAVPLVLRDLEPWTPSLGTPRRLVPVSKGPEPRRKDSGCLDFTTGKKPSA